MATSKELIRTATDQGNPIVLTGEKLQNFMEQINPQTGRPNGREYPFTPEIITFYPYSEKEQRKLQEGDKPDKKRYNSLFHGLGSSNSGVRTTKSYNKKDEF